MSEQTEQPSKTSDEILNELFTSIAPQQASASEDGELSSADEKTRKKAKKAKKEKKEKKEKKSKKKSKNSSPKRKSKPLSPLRRVSSTIKPLDEWERRSVSPRRPRHDPYPRDHRDQRDYRASKNHQNSRDHQSSRDHQGSRDHQDSRDYQNSRDHHSSRDHQSSRDHHRCRDEPRSDRYRNESRGGHRSRDEQRPPKRSNTDHHDPFWDNRWDAMQLQKQAEEKERRGRHFLDDNKGNRQDGKKRPRKSKSPSPETDELKQLKKMKMIQDLVVKEEEKYVAEPLDPNLFEWDNKVKMWKRKPEGQKSGEKSYEEELKERMEEQFQEGKRKAGDNIKTEEGDSKEVKDEESEAEVPAEKAKDPIEEEVKKEAEERKKWKKLDEAKMSLDEIEEIKRKREKFKERQKSEKEKGENQKPESKEKDEKEEGEVQSDDENDKKKSKKNYRSKNRSNSYERKLRSRSREVSTRHRSRSREKSSRNRSRSREMSSRHQKRHRSRSREFYPHQRNRSRSREGSFRHRSRSREHARHRSRSRDRRYVTSFRSSRDGRGYRDRESDRYRSSRQARSRSRDRRDSFRGSRSEIDKAKLLAIAKKNAVKLLSSDNLMGMDHDKLIAIKSGGQNLSQLVSFCRELASKGITDEFDDDDDILYGDQEADDVHHPFEVKDRPIPNPYSSLGVSGERLTPAMKTAAMSHRMLEFPVSSGNAHRVKEATVKEESDPEPEKNEVKAIEDKSEPVVEEKSEAQKLNEANPLGVIMFGGVPEVPKEPELAVSSSSAEDKKPADKVFDPVLEPSKDISLIVSQRLGAMKKLSENPNDTEALTLLYDAQQEMAKWATSKNKPGQFTGHTGAKILSHAELSTGVQAWARQEQFSKAQKVSGGFGEFMLRKMGWSEGDGLGRTRSGDVDPLTLDIKMDKKGLMSAEEDTRKRRGGNSEPMTLTACKDLSHKHPVSGLMELATKRKWGPPNFVQIFECGPPHKKQYIFKVTVNGTDYQPTIASDNKKKAKADAAAAALQQMGLLPIDPNNPL